MSYKNTLKVNNFGKKYKNQAQAVVQINALEENKKEEITKE